MTVIYQRLKFNSVVTKVLLISYCSLPLKNQLVVFAVDELIGVPSANNNNVNVQNTYTLLILSPLELVLAELEKSLKTALG